LQSCLIAGCVLWAHTILSGCVSSQPIARARSTILLSVTLRAEDSNGRLPTGLVVDINEAPGSFGTRQFAFAANTRIPGQYTTFLIRLDLPAGAHRLTRLSGVSGRGETVPAFDLATNLPFEVKSAGTHYLGHIEWSAPHLALSDSYENDLPEFLQAWPALRGHPIERRAPAKSVAIPAEWNPKVAHDQAQPARAASGAAARLDASAAAALPAHTRAAFQVFLKSGYPRAFAISKSGAVGTATGGRDVIRRALQDCRKRAQPESRRSSCTLFAVDDTLISSIEASPPRVTAAR
jgi:hypothetical protein